MLRFWFCSSFRLVGHGWVLLSVAMALLFVPVAHAERVKLAWDPNLEPDLGGYRIYYGTNPQDYSSTVDVGIATEGVVEDLLPGMEYFFAVTAYNQAGLESEPSDPIAFRTAQVFKPQVFTGLLGEGGGGLSGSFQASLRANGSVSGRVVLDGKAYGWRGIFDGNGALSVEFSGAMGAVISLSLHLAAGGNSIQGLAQMGGQTAELLAYSIPRVTAHPSAGRYTMVLAQDDSAVGGGYGFGTIQVSKRGSARFAGTLPSGAKFGLGVRLDSAASASVYQFQRGKGRRIAGRVLFRDLPQVSDADGILQLQLPGADGEITLQAARYLPGARAARSVGVVSQNQRFLLEVNFLHETDSISVELAGGNPLVGQANSGEVVTLRVSTRSGLFSGGSKSSAGGAFKFAGAVYQKSEPLGFGRVRGAEGSIELHPLLPD